MLTIVNVNIGLQIAIGSAALAPLANCNHYSLMILYSLSQGKCFPAVFLMTTHIILIICVLHQKPKNDTTCFVNKSHFLEIYIGINIPNDETKITRGLF